MACQLSPDRLKEVVAFHGHHCPGLTIGIRASEYALDRLGGPEAELVAVVETDMCGVDAIQFLTGCTYGKGNLIHRDYGKMAFSFMDRSTGRGFRLLLRPEARGSMDREMAELMAAKGRGEASEADSRRLAELRAGLMNRFMELDLEDMFYVADIDPTPPRPAQILQSLTCEECGEMVMESRTRRIEGRTLCIPCFGALEQKV